MLAPIQAGKDTWAAVLCAMGLYTCQSVAGYFTYSRNICAPNQIVE